MTIDISKLRTGDIVHVKGVFKGISSLHQYANVDVDGDVTWVSPKDIVHVEPRPPQPGDFVRWRCNKTRLGKLLAIDVDAGMAWIKTDAKMWTTVTVAEIEKE